MKEDRWKTKLLRSGYLEISVAAVIAGSVGLFVKRIDLPASTITFGRFLFGCLALLALRAGSGSLTCPRGKKSVGLLLLTGLLTAMAWLTFMSAFKYIPVANTVLLAFCSPVIITFLAHRFLRERVQGIAVAALVLATAGAALIALPGARAMSQDDLIGMALAVSSAWLGAAETIAIKKVDKSLSSEVLNIYRYGVAATFLLPFVLPNGLSMTWKAFLLTLALGVVHTALAGTIYVLGLRKAEVHKASILGYLEPLSATVLAWLFLSEYPSLFTVLGGGSILLASYLVVRSRVAEVRPTAI